MPTESLYAFVIPILILFTPAQRWTSRIQLFVWQEWMSLDKDDG